LKETRGREERPPVGESPAADPAADESDYALARKHYVRLCEQQGIAFQSWGAVWARTALEQIARFAARQAELDGITSGQVIGAVLESYFADPAQAKHTWNLQYLGSHAAEFYLRHPGVVAVREARQLKAAVGS
jgi:hypothetical protein